MSRIVCIWVAVIAGAINSQAEPVPPEFQISPALGNVWPLFSSNWAGDFIVAWNHDDEAFARIYSSADSTLGPEIQIPITSPERPPWPITSIALGPDRGFVVTQAGFSSLGLTSGVAARVYDFSGTPRSPEIGGVADDSHSPNVVMDAAGGFVLWFGHTDWFGGPMETLSGGRFDASGTFTASLFRMDHVTSAHVSMNASGALVVSWGDQPFLVRKISSDNLAGPILEVASDANFRIRRSYLRDDGRFTSLWSTRDGLFGRHYSSSGAPAESVFEFESAPGFLVAIEEEGFIVVGSVRPDGLARNVVARRYDWRGAPRGPEFQVNVHAGGQNSPFAVAAPANGTFVVTWVRDGTIYGRIFDATTSVNDGTWTDLKKRFRR